MEMITVGPMEARPALLRPELQKAAASMKSKPKLALVFMPMGIPQDTLLRTISNTLEIPAIGASHAGITFTEHGLGRGALACALIGGDDLQIACSVARDVKATSAESMKEACDELIAAQRAYKGKSNLSVLVFSDAFACDGELVVTSLRKYLPAHARCFGGLAADNWTFDGTRVFIGNEVLADAVVMAALITPERMHMAAQHGWSSFELGRDLTITDAEANILKGLDGRPAYEAYEDELRRLGLRHPDESPVSLMAKYEIGARTPFGEELKIRAPLGLNEADGSIVLAAGLPVGTIVRIVRGSTNDLVSAVTDLRSKVNEAVGKPMRGMFAIDCAARVQLLRESVNDEYAAFRADGKCPLIGTSVYGEIAKFGGSMEGFHNTTAVIAAW